MRNHIIDFLKKELIGPDPIAPFIQPNGEEVLLDMPRQRYGAAILYPQKYPVENGENLSDEESTMLDTNEERLEEIEEATDRNQINNHGDYDGDPDEEGFEDIVNLTNSYFPSAIGLSCFLQIPEKGLVLSVKAGRYKHGEFEWKDEKEGERKRKAYLRESIHVDIPIQARELPLRPKQNQRFPIKIGAEETGLTVHITNRSNGDPSDQKYLLTFSLVNELQGNEGTQHDSEKCFFQVEMKVSSAEDEAPFLPYPENKYLRNDDDKVNQLLYRNYQSYAIGHGCAAHWEEERIGAAKSVETRILPDFEMRPILPAKLDDVELSMLNLSDYGDFEEGINHLKLLCSKYKDWIQEQKKQSSFLDEDLQETAKKQIENCERCLNRMWEGIRLLESDGKVLQAFQYMNRAMLTQQLRYSFPLRKWYENNPEGIEKFQDIVLLNKKTWPKQNLGHWRPFQIAFILMNLKSLAEPKSSDRDITDIIWFPTGGGKTEAYLGLTAFTIFMRRLNNPMDTGTSVLMRYTLRLLTTQQFQRAAALITACEHIREDIPDVLGEERITIGLWVGDSLSPNTRQDARSMLSKMSQKKTDENPFVLLKCPWCGAQMGPVIRRKRDSQPEVKGYYRTKETVIYECSDSDCHFSHKTRPLPLLVIDEDIYKNPPALVIATVDKFAMLPWKDEARVLFGFRKDGERVSPPELIIQDELHLISGPLGSMVGHYEILITALCKNPETGTGPKIVASTATISRAKEQAHALYNCGIKNVFQFPPQCIEAGESFFAYVERDATKVPGRIYVGVHASGLPSHATAQVRVISALSQSVKMKDVKDEQERNPYWTIVNYFNSLRELGHAATLVSADIDEYIRAMWVRKNISKESGQRRYINKSIELTSRAGSSEIPKYLQELEFDYLGSDKSWPVDFCLATNMISVGLDISRLGLMTVIGQPKTTSEYIQATSRVGRSAEGPGLVFVIYNTSKPRDRSLYEQFYSYHNKIYSYVEPTSVTPFATPVRERALHALMAGLVRYLGKEDNLKLPNPPDEELQNLIKQTILDRVANIDPTEFENTRGLIDERFEEWEKYGPVVYGNPMGQNLNPPLLYPASMATNYDLKNKAWPTPTSMRSVDVECVADVINGYPEEGEGN